MLRSTETGKGRHNRCMCRRNGEALLWVKDNLLKHLFFSKIFVPLRATHAMRKGNGDVLLTMLHVSINNKQHYPILNKSR